MDEQFLLSKMIQDMEQAPDCFKPTNFWNSGLQLIVEDLRKDGFSRFREHASSKVFFAPLYEKSAWRKRFDAAKPLIDLVDRLRPQNRIARRIELWVSGEMDAFQDYRLFKAADTPGGLPIAEVSESDIGGGERFTFEGKRMGASFLNYLRGLAFLKKHFDTNSLSSLMEIGGGYGTLGEILLKTKPGFFYIDVDIPPVAAVSTYYLQQVFGKENVFTYLDAGDKTIDLDALKGRYKAAVICPWQLPQLTGSVDIFANFISFQEMEPDVVENYARIVQKHTSQAVLLRNAASGKDIAKKEGEIGVMRPTTTDQLIRFFDQFQLLGRDALGCGFQDIDRRYSSEVLCFARKNG